MTNESQQQREQANSSVAKQPQPSSQATANSGLNKAANADQNRGSNPVKQGSGSNDHAPPGAHASSNNPTPTGTNGQGGASSMAQNGGAGGAGGPKDRSRDLSTAKTAQSTPQNPNPNANRTIGHYLVGRALGQGTFGKVRLGTHLITGEKVAIKILEKDKIKDQSDVERVTREIHILKIVRHPNVIQLYEVSEDLQHLPQIIETSRQLFLIMEYASGGELFDYIVKRKRLQEDEACRFTQQIISGVEYIHKVRICHRDLKPENLLLDDQNNIKIVDFGLSNMYAEGETLKTACGSPCYAAPEMIAGKRYHGLNSDIWSCGIILYAMTCGYLPFEDPNTSKLYKKILNCDYLIPGFISKPSKDLIKKILNTDPTKRFTVTDIRTHEWYNQVKPLEMEGIVIGKDRVPVIEEFLGKIQDCFNQSGITPNNCDLSQTVTYIQNNKHNQITSTYYLLLKKKQRETGRDYFFEQVMRDKKRNLYSTSNLNNITLNSLQKIQTPGKIMMHSTMGSGFKVNQVSKSEARPLQTQEGFGTKFNPATKKYLEQMNKIQKKRTESTAQARLADMMSNFKQNGMDKHAMTNSPLADTLIHQNNQNYRGAQSQSPTQRMNGMLGAQKPNQTFFMADRMRKQGGSNAVGGNRPLSIDEMNTTGIILQSTNDSRIHEMLPNVNQIQQKSNMFNQTRVGNFNSNKLAQTQQQQQMRQTMFNGNFMTKLRSSNAGQSPNQQMPQQYQQYDNVMYNHSSDRDQGATSSFGNGQQASSVGNHRIGTTNGTAASNQAHLFNLVNQRKTPNTNSNQQQQQMMMTTQFFNSGGQNTGVMNGINQSGNGSISKTIAQAKLRKQRANRGASNPIHDQGLMMSEGSNGGDYNGGQFNATLYPTHARKKSITNNTAMNGQFNANFQNAGQANMGFSGGSSGPVNPHGGSANSTGNHTAISGGRKPTADSHAYTLYKPNKQNARGKFSNGGGSLSGAADQSFNGGYLQNNVLVDKQNNLYQQQNNFNTGPNSTASRFYNPNKQSSPTNAMNETSSRFMQNIQNVKPKIGGSGSGGVFQNNFLLPKASPNAGMLKTFYNSKQSTSGSSNNASNMAALGGPFKGYPRG